MAHFTQNKDTFKISWMNIYLFMHLLKLKCILMLSTDKFCFWQAATDWARACTGSVQFTVLYCVIMNEVVRRETPSIEGKRGIALQLYSRGSVILCFKVQTDGDMYYSKMFQMTFLFIFTPRAWLHIIIFFCFDSTTDGSFTQAFWCQQASSSDINSSFITCTIEFLFWTTSWQTPPGPPRIWTSPLLSISLPLIKTIFDTMFRIKWRNVFAKIVACMVILRSTVNHVSNVFSIVIVIVSTLMSVIMPTLPVFNIL